MASVLLDIRGLAGSLCSCELLDMQLGSELLRRVLELHPVPLHSIVKLLVDMEPLRLAVPLKDQGISNGSVITYARQPVAPEEEFQIVTKVLRHGYAALSLDESQIWDAAEANLVARLGGAETSPSKNNPAVISPDTLPALWVTKWMDYSSKYGVGYIMSDQSIGVYFNDSTRIILAPKGSCFDYITRRTQEKQEIRTTHNLEEYPDDLKKKVLLLQHFKNGLEGRIDKKGVEIGESSLLPAIQTWEAWKARESKAQPWEAAVKALASPSSGIPLDLRRDLRQTWEARKAESDARTGLAAASGAFEPGQLTFHEYMKCRTHSYVKKWTRNKHAIMFQLSNEIVQVVFFDKTEAVLSSKAHMVTYVDKKSQICSYPLSDVMDVPSPELAKRLRFTKDMFVTPKIHPGNMSGTDGEIDENREHVDIQEDNESFAGSTCGEVQALCDKAQFLVSQMSAFVTPPVPPPSGAVRAFVVGPGPGPGRPPRPPQAAVSTVPGANYSLVASPVGSAFGSVGPSEIEDDEMNQLKFRVSHIELGLKRRGVGAQDSPSCSEEVALLRRQLEETQLQLLGAVDEIQDAKSQIHKLAARLNLIPLAGGSSSLSVGGSFHAPHRQSTPNHLLKPHLIAAPTPTVLAISATTPRDSPAPTARLAPTPRDSPAPTARIQRRPSSPQCMAQTVLGPAPSRPASPLLATHICRRTSTDGTSSPHPAPTACQLSLAASNAGMASTASFNPPLLVRVGSQNGSQRVSPLRTHGHVQSAQLFEGTPPPTARLCAQQMQFGNVLTDRGQIMRENPNLVAQAAQKLQFHSTMPTARGNPIRVGGVPTHVLRSPRV